MSRLSAPCCDFVGEVEESIPPRRFARRLRPVRRQAPPMEKRRFPVRIQGRKSSRRKGRCRMAAPPQLTVSGRAGRFKTFRRF